MNDISNVVTCWQNHARVLAEKGDTILDIIVIGVY